MHEKNRKKIIRKCITTFTQVLKWRPQGNTSPTRTLLPCRPPAAAIGDVKVYLMTAFAPRTLPRWGCHQANAMLIRPDAYGWPLPCKRPLSREQPLLGVQPRPQWPCQNEAAGHAPKPISGCQKLCMDDLCPANGICSVDSLCSEDHSKMKPLPSKSRQRGRFVSRIQGWQPPYKQRYRGGCQML